MNRRVTSPWDIWGGCGWPATADAEAQFVADLTAAAGGRTVDMADVDPLEVVCLMTALRVSAPVEQVLSRATGLDPAHLLAVHRDLDRRLRAARAGWEAITTDATIDTLDEAGPAAAPLVGLLIERLHRAAAMTPDLFADEVGRVAGRTVGIGQLCDTIEQRLDGIAAPSQVGVDLGRQLFDPSQSCLWYSPLFIPTRVTQLSPVRVSDLLGWRRDDPRQL